MLISGATILLLYSRGHFTAGAVEWPRLVGVGYHDVYFRLSTIMASVLESLVTGDSLLYWQGWHLPIAMSEFQSKNALLTFLSTQ